MKKNLWYMTDKLWFAKTQKAVQLLKGPPNTNFKDIIKANFFRDIVVWFDCSIAILRRV